MSLEKTFYLLKAAEAQVGALYSLMGLSVSVSHPALFDLFTELAEEEKMHCKQIELMQNIFLQSKDGFAENPEAEKLIAEFMQNIDTVRHYFNQKHQELKVSDLLNLAHDLETNLVEKHRTFFMQVTDPQLKALFASLNMADESHVRKLENFQPG
jgi:rubrerythrin